MEDLHRVMAQRGRSLEFSREEVEDLADMGIGDRRLFALLALLSPFIDLRNHQFHVDHVFPRSRFTPSQLRAAGVDDEEIDTFSDCANRIANLQLLDGDINNEKRKKMPSEWMQEHFPDVQSRQHYCHLYHLGSVPEEIADFMDFYRARRERLQERVAELVNSV